MVFELREKENDFDEETIYLIGCGNTHDYTTFETFMVANSPNGLGTDNPFNSSNGGSNTFLNSVNTP